MRLVLVLIATSIHFVSFLQKTGTLVLSGDANYYGYDKSEFVVYYNEEVLGHFDKNGHFSYSIDQQGPLKIKHPDFDVSTVDNLTVSRKMSSHNVFEKISPEAEERILKLFKTEQSNTCTGSDKKELLKAPMVDTAVRFPGGDIEMKKFLAENIKYPQQAIELGIEGKVYLSFIVEADGSVTCIEVLRGVDYLLDREAFRCLKSFPKFIPAMRGGVAVPSGFIFPISFHLN